MSKYYYSLDACRIVPARELNNLYASVNTSYSFSEWLENEIEYECSLIELTLTDRDSYKLAHFAECVNMISEMSPWDFTDGEIVELLQKSSDAELQQIYVDYSLFRLEAEQ